MSPDGTVRPRGRGVDSGGSGIVEGPSRGLRGSALLAVLVVLVVLLRYLLG